MTTAVSRRSSPRRSRHAAVQPLASIRSPSRTPVSTTINPPRALRWARFLFYAVAAPTFLYSLYVQIYVLKGPGRTPLPASVSFGRDTVFLTFHGNFHCTWYACLCLLNAFLALSIKRRQSRTARSIEVIVYRTTAMLFPLAAFVGIAYYLILHFHPLNRLRAQMVPDHDSKMALLHLHPLLFAVGDSLLKDAELFVRHGMKQRRAVRGIMWYGTGYFFWTVFCNRLNGGHWPYPFQKSFTVVQHLAFLLFALVSSMYLTRAGFRLHGRIDRRRRRRLALKERAYKEKVQVQKERTHKEIIARRN